MPEHERKKWPGMLETWDGSGSSTSTGPNFLWVGLLIPNNGKLALVVGVRFADLRRGVVAVA